MQERLATADIWIIYSLLFVVVLAISWMVSSLFSKAQEIKESGKVTKRRTMGAFTSFVLMLVVAVVVLVLAVSRMYVAFTAHDLIATVECRHAYGFGRDAFEVLFSPIVDGKAQPEQSFILKGDKWSVGGDILEWQSVMTFFGLKSMYRLVRVQGNYNKAEDDMSKGITAFPLVEDEQSEFWRTLSDIAVKMPFIRSAHQNYVSTFPYFGDTFHIYATPSGFTLERLEEDN